MASLPTPNLIDAAALIVIAVCAFRGSRRGLSGELAQAAALAVAFVLGLRFHPAVAAWLEAHSRLDARAAQGTAFAAVVAAGFVVMLLLRYVLGAVMKVVIEKKFDRTGGCLAGACRGCLLTAIVFLVMNMWPHEYLNRKFGEESLVGTLLGKCVPVAEEESDST